MSLRILNVAENLKFLKPGYLSLFPCEQKREKKNRQLIHAFAFIIEV